MGCLNIVYKIIGVILLAKLIRCQLESPCPNVFQYQYGTNNNPNELYGLIQAPLVYDNSNVIKLEVQLSLGNPVQEYNGNIQLGASRTEIISDLMNNRPLRYRLHFPRWINVYPKVTRILINGKEICSGSSVDRSLVPVVTTINLQHSLTISSANNLKLQDNWRGLTNTFITTPKPQTNPKEAFFFILGGPSGNEQSSNTYFKNPFLNQLLSNNQEFGSSFGATNFPFENDKFPFSSTNLQFGKAPSNNQVQIPDTSNKFGVETTGNVFLAPKNTQPNDLPTVDTNLVTQPPSDNCGISVNSNNLLVNGNRFARNQHPWLAALFMQNDEGLKFMCGTSLISKRHVVTAAHCIRNRRKKYNPEELWIVLGRENIQRWSNDGAQIIQAKSTYYYPDHEFHTADADIAIIVLSEEVVFSPLVRPVCLWNGNPDENLIVGQNGTVVGWGKDEQGRIFTPEPRQVTMPVVSEETCLRSNPGFREITSNRTFCAGNRDSSGPCNGDSGTGFLIKKLGRWYLRGVVSMSLLGSDGNCDLREYIVFTDAAKYTDWIRSYVQ